MWKKKEECENKGFLGLNLFFSSLSDWAHIDHIQSWIIANLCQVTKLLGNEKYPPNFQSFAFAKCSRLNRFKHSEFGYTADS